MKKVVISTLFCKRCGHRWYPRVPKKPDVCPKCKSPYWDKEYTRADMVNK